VATDENTAVAIVLTPGQTHDSQAWNEIQNTLPEDHQLHAVVADKAYDTNEIRNDLARKGIQPVIPPLKTRVAPPKYNKKRYRERNRIERLVSKFKQFRRIATRYEKLGPTYLGLLQLVAAFLIVR
jgi:transposase